MTLRVAFIDHSARLSGAELFLAGMIEHADDIDATVVLFEDGPLRPRLERSGIRVELCLLPTSIAAVTADVRRRGLSGSVAPALGLPAFATRLGRLLRRIDPALVYTNSAKAHVLGIPLARIQRRPVVMHVHDLLDDGSFSRLNLTLLRAATRGATQVMVNSAATAATLPAGVSASVVPCPTEVRTPALPDHAKPSPFSFAVVGRIADWKGQHIAVEALARLRGGDQPDATLHLYGAPTFDKDHEYSARLERDIARRGLTDAVLRHGHVDDVYASMRQHTVVAHTSVKPEPFGQVVVEAMAAGVPVVAANAGGPAEIITDGKDGLLYEAGDAASLAQVLGRIARETDLAGTLVPAAHRRAADFSYDRVIPGWLELIRQSAALR